MMDGIQGIRFLRKFGHVTPCTLVKRWSDGRDSRILFCHEEAIVHLEQVCMLLIPAVLEMDQAMDYRELS